jgi:hypothetical protein
MVKNGDFEVEPGRAGIGASGVMGEVMSGIETAVGFGGVGK